MGNITWSELQREMYQCDKCTRRPTRQLDAPFFGLGNLNADIMFVGESPGYQTRQLNGMVFCGNRSGDFLLQLMAENKLHFGNSFLTNVVRCQKKNNEKPSPAEIKQCCHFLEEEIKLVQPLLIVCVGGVALEYFTGQSSVTNFVNKYKILDNGITLTAIYHPAYILRKGGEKSTSPLYQEYDKSFKFLLKLLDHLRSKNKEKRSDIGYWVA
jgi:DNA polymerase